MNIGLRNKFKVFSMVVLSIMMTATFTSVAAQDTELKRQAATIKKKSRAVTATVATDPVAQLVADIQQCGMPCKVGASKDIAAPGGGTLDYNCNEEGDCSCFGAKDCVAMADVCKEGSMGCNKQGCVCEEDPGG